MLQSRTYRPALPLRAILGRYYVFTADLPGDLLIGDRLLSDTAFIRLLLRGDWQAESSPGNWTRAASAVLFGSNSRPLPVRVRGAFSVIGISVRPAGWKALFGAPAAECADDMIGLSAFYGRCADFLVEAVAAARDDLQIVRILDRFFTQVMMRFQDNLSHRRAAAMDSLLAQGRLNSVTALADGLDLSARQLERFSREHFGFSPKTILRRQRFLTVASAMRGLSALDWDVEASERYFDQSHLNREFRQFIGLTPSTFMRAPTPLLDAGLKLRADAAATRPLSILDAA